MGKFRGPHGSALDQLIDAFEQLVIRALKKVAAAAANLLRSGSRPTGDDLGVIRSLWAGVVDDVLLPALEKLFGTSAKTVAEEVGALTAPDPADFLRAARDRLLGVGDRLWNIAREELAQGVEAGEDIPALAARVTAAAGTATDWAVVVARTEVVSANNAASLAQARALGDPSMIKEWIATPDQRTRPSHRKADGQRVRIGDQFEVGGAKLDFPGDPTGDPDLTWNCRCSMAFDLDDTPLTAAKSAYDETHNVKRDEGGKFSRTGAAVGLDALKAAVARLPDRKVDGADEDAELSFDEDPGWGPRSMAASSRALRLYRNSTYRKVNGYLRDPDNTDDRISIREKTGHPAVKEHIVDEHILMIDQAMEDAPLARNVELWRGVQNASDVFGDAWNDENMVGTTWREQAFVSSSADVNVAATFGFSTSTDVLLRLHAPAGVGAVQLDGWRDKSRPNGEAELLLQRDLRFTIVGDQVEPVGDPYTVTRFRVNDAGGDETYTETIEPDQHRVLDVQVEPIPEEDL